MANYLTDLDPVFIPLPPEISEYGQILMDALKSLNEGEPEQLAQSVYLIAMLMEQVGEDAKVLQFELEEIVSSGGFYPDLNFSFMPEGMIMSSDGSNPNTMIADLIVTHFLSLLPDDAEPVIIGGQNLCDKLRVDSFSRFVYLLTAKGSEYLSDEQIATLKVPYSDEPIGDGAMSFAIGIPPDSISVQDLEAGYQVTPGVNVNLFGVNVHISGWNADIQAALHEAQAIMKRFNIEGVQQVTWGKPDRLKDALQEYGYTSEGISAAMETLGAIANAPVPDEIDVVYCAYVSQETIELVYEKDIHAELKALNEKHIALRAFK